MPSWSVICYANEAPEHLRAFVAWHLAQGAEKIHLMLDNTDGEVENMFDHLPQVHARVFRPDYWTIPEGKTEVGRKFKHDFLSTKAYHESRSDWVLHIDVDEFILPETSVEQTLESVPDDVPGIRVYAADRLLPGPHSHWASDIYRFETKDRNPEWLDQVYAHPHQLNFGLRGHADGKVFIRGRQKGLQLRSHRIEKSGKAVPIRRSKWSTEFTLLHMFVFDYEHYLRKGEWKFVRGPRNRIRDEIIDNPTARDQRRIEIATAFEHSDDDLKKRLFDDMFVFSEERIEKLREFQRVEQVNFTAPLSRYIQQYFP